MPDMIAYIRENNRRTVRGMSFDDRTGRLTCQIMEGETIKPKLNMEHWLGNGVYASWLMTAMASLMTRHGLSVGLTADPPVGAVVPVIIGVVNAAVALLGPLCERPKNACVCV